MSASNRSRLIDYDHRRTALADWRIPTDDWQAITGPMIRPARGGYATPVREGGVP
jgi:hypothetical protein